MCLTPVPSGRSLSDGRGADAARRLDARRQHRLELAREALFAPERDRRIHLLDRLDHMHAGEGRAEARPTRSAIGASPTTVLACIGRKCSAADQSSGLKWVSRSSFESCMRV